MKMYYLAWTYCNTTNHPCQRNGLIIDNNDEYLEEHLHCGFSYEDVFLALDRHIQEDTGPNKFWEVLEVEV